MKEGLNTGQEGEKKNLYVLCGIPEDIEKLTGKPLLESCQKVSSWISQYDTMVDKTPEEIAKFLEEGRGMTVLSKMDITQNYDVIGFCGLTTPVGKTGWELGSLVKGVAAKDVGTVATVGVLHLPIAQQAETIIAYCNPISLRLFTNHLQGLMKVGATVLTESEALEIHPSLTPWKNDVIVDLTPVAHAVRRT